MSQGWQDVRCARIREADLPALADLRREEGIRAALEGGRAWIFWEDSDDPRATRRILVERLFPLPGVELYTRRDGRWHRPGEHLPAFDVPAGDGIPIGRLILPGSVPIASAHPEETRPVALRVVRDDRGIARAASALRCRLRDLSPWADLAPSARLAALLGAWCAPADGEAEAIVIGRADRLPPIADGLRFWGDSVLIPLGFRPDPELDESALREVVGAGPREVVLLESSGPEFLPRDAFRPLHRAGIRLAMAGGAPT